MVEQLESLRVRALEEIARAIDLVALDVVRVTYSGRNGLLASLTRSLGEQPLVDRPVIGATLNRVKGAVESALQARRHELSGHGANVARSIDLTLPARSIPRGGRHVLTNTIHDVTQIFRGMGFEWVDGPELEDEYHNFDALNTPKDHPARDLQGSLYVADGRVLRTHTSPVQIRTMKVRTPPLQVFTIGKCRRADMPDASHGMTFFQLEGLMIGKDIHFGHLKGVLDMFFSALFGPRAEVRMVPSFFPFTEPSAEGSVKCVYCVGDGSPSLRDGSQGVFPSKVHRDGPTLPPGEILPRLVSVGPCRVCKGTGWLELFGAGMVHPRVLREVGYDPELWQGFAFGCGVERLAMILHGIDDLRLIFQNDLRFVKQFS